MTHTVDHPGNPAHNPEDVTQQGVQEDHLRRGPGEAGFGKGEAIVAILQEDGRIRFPGEEAFWLPITRTEEAWKTNFGMGNYSEGTQKEVCDGGADILRRALGRFLLEG